MFGKPQWFRPKTFGWGLTPITSQGWAYALIACAVIAGPFALLISQHLVPEAVLWMAISIGVLVWDVRQILREIRRRRRYGNVDFFDEHDR